MTWHELPELPKPDTEVMAEVKAHTTRFIVLVHDGHNWQHPNPYFANYAYKLREEYIKRWAYIEEEEK